MQAMHDGLNLPIAADAADGKIEAEFAAIAEDSGWDGVLLEDYIVYQNRLVRPTYDPWVGLAAMAMHTTRIRLGTEVTPLPHLCPR